VHKKTNFACHLNAIGLNLIRTLVQSTPQPKG
jgi:hypothetical protein